MNEVTFDWPLRVYYEDTDCAGVVYYANYLKFMERARTEWLRKLGWSQEEMRQSLHLLFVVSEAHVRYRRPAHLDDSLTVRSKISSCKKASLVFSQEILRGEEVLACGEIRCGCLNSDTLRPEAMPENVYKQFCNLAKEDQ